MFGAGRRPWVFCAGRRSSTCFAAGRRLLHARGPRCAAGRHGVAGLYSPPSHPKWRAPHPPPNTPAGNSAHGVTTGQGKGGAPSDDDTSAASRRGGRSRSRSARDKRPPLLPPCRTRLLSRQEVPTCTHIPMPTCAAGGDTVCKRGRLGLPIVV